MYDVDSGEIKIEENINKLNLYNLRSSIGYVPQDGYLFSGTIRENITFSSNEFNRKMIECAKNASILEEIENLETALTHS